MSQAEAHAMMVLWHRYQIAACPGVLTPQPPNTVPLLAKLLACLLKPNHVIVLLLLTTLLGNELTYFEMDQMGQLLEMAKKELDEAALCLDIAPVLPGSLRCK